MFKTDPASTRVIDHAFKNMGLIIIAFGALSLLLKQYWEPMLANFLFASGYSAADVKFYLYVIGFYPMTCVAVGGYLAYRSREKPLRPSKKEVDEGKF